MLLMYVLQAVVARRLSRSRVFIRYKTFQLLWARDVFCVDFVESREKSLSVSITFSGISHLASRGGGRKSLV